MITVKAFKKDEKGLYTMPKKNKYYFEVGKTYKHKGKVAIYALGFHASANCDISDTLPYYNSDSHYCLVDINKVYSDGDIVVGDIITILKELTFNECIEYDKTGRWCIHLIARNRHRLIKNKLRDDDIKLLVDSVIAKDKTGRLCYECAKVSDNLYVNILQEAVIAKDTTGDICCNFARRIVAADVELLQDAVIAKDKTGIICYKFNKYVTGANSTLLLNAIKEKHSNFIY